MAPHHTNDLAPLLRYESSQLAEGVLTSISECIPASPICRALVLLTRCRQVQLAYEGRSD
jgi:hypothetical protein